MSEEKKEGGENGTFGEVVMGMALLGVLCFICAERFVTGIYGVVVADWLYATGIVVVVAAIVGGLRGRREKMVKMTEKKKMGVEKKRGGENV